jgi:hypothetical protein
MSKKLVLLIVFALVFAQISGVAMAQDTIKIKELIPRANMFDMEIVWTTKSDDFKTQILRVTTISDPSLYLELEADMHYYNAYGLTPEQVNTVVTYFGYYKPPVRDTYITYDTLKKMGLTVRFTNENRTLAIARTNDGIDYWFGGNFTLAGPGGIVMPHTLWKRIWHFANLK